MTIGRVGVDLYPLQDQGGALVAGAWAVFGDDGSASSSSSTCDVTPGVADRVRFAVGGHPAGQRVAGPGAGSGVVVRTPLPGADTAGAAPAAGGSYILTDEH